jgi:hypothetical protein
MALRGKVVSLKDEIFEELFTQLSSNKRDI